MSLAGTDHWNFKPSANIQCKKNNHSTFLIFQKLFRNINKKAKFLAYFGPLKKKLQIIYAATYIALFLSDSNNCFFICLVSHIPFYLCYSLILCFYFHVLFFSFLATSHVLQFTVFNLISFYSLSVILRR